MSNHLNEHSSLAAQSLQQLKRDIILIPLGYPWTLSPPVFFFVNSSSSLASLLIIYTCTSFLLKLLATWEGRRKRSTIFSFLLKNWREWSTLFSWEPFGLWSAIWCLRTCQPLLSDSSMIYVSVQNQFQFPLRSLPLVCWNERATLVVIQYLLGSLIVCDHTNYIVSSCTVGRVVCIHSSEAIDTVRPKDIGYMDKSWNFPSFDCRHREEELHKALHRDKAKVVAIV